MGVKGRGGAERRDRRVELEKAERLERMGAWRSAKKAVKKGREGEERHGCGEGEEVGSREEAQNERWRGGAERLERRRTGRNGKAATTP